MQGDRHYRLRIDQRMPGIAQHHLALVVHQRCPGTHPECQLCFGKDHIQPNQQLHIQINVLTVSGRFGRKFGQNALNFLFFLQFQFPQCVVCVHRGHGFNKEGRAGSRNIMNHTRHIIAAFAFHRDHIPSLTDGNNRFPQELGIGRRRNDFL